MIPTDNVSLADEPLVEIVTILNKKGLHARAAAKFVRIVNSHNAEVKVTRLKVGQTLFDGEDGSPWVASGGSVLGVLTLGAEQGSQLRLTAGGEDAGKVLAELRALIERKFDEE